MLSLLMIAIEAVTVQEIGERRRCLLLLVQLGGCFAGESQIINRSYLSVVTKQEHCDDWNSAGKLPSENQTLKKQE